MLSIILQILLALMFLVAGLPKFGSNHHIEDFKSYGYPQWFRIFTAVVEVVTAILLIIGIWNHQLAAIGGIFVFVTMIGAILTLIKIKARFKNIVLPIILLILGGIVLSQNYSDLIG